MNAAAIRMFGRTCWRRDWRPLVLLAVAVACSAGLVMTAAIGARRAGSAWERFARDTRSPDVFKDVATDDGDAVLADLLTRPGVETATLMGYMTLAPEGRVPSGTKPPGAFVGLSAGFGSAVYRPLILRGRAADPTRSDELTINQKMADLTGLGPGDRITVVSYPAVVHQPATIVGIQAGPLDVTLNAAQAGALMTPAFGAAWFDKYLGSLKPEDRSKYTKVLMARVPAKSDQDAFLAEGFVRGQAFGQEAIGGLNAQRTAFLVLVVAGAIGTVLATGQAISRRVRRDASELSALAAIGLTPRRRQLAIALAPWTAAAIGFACAPAVAFVASPSVSIGVTRLLAVNRPHIIDLTVMLPGLAAALVVVATIAWASARRSDAQPKLARPHPLPISLPGPAGLFGGRAAAGWATPAARTVARSHLAGAVLGLAAVTGVCVWSAAARHVVATPARYGVLWDATVEPIEDVQFSFDPTVLASATSRIAADPRVGVTIATVVVGMYDAGTENPEIDEIDRAKTAWWPTVTAGRAPTADNEVTVGLGVPIGVGGSVEIGGRKLTVVGRHVLAPLSNGSPGGSIVMSRAAVPGLSLTSPNVVLLVRLAPGASVADLRRLAGDGLAVYGTADTTVGDVANLGRNAGLIKVLLAACAALALASFANGLIVASRTRRADYSTLRALGARQRTIAGSIAWHGSLIALIGAFIGIPVGVVVGRIVWRHTANGVNAVPDLWRWPADAAAVAAATAVVAGLVVVGCTAIPGRRPSTRRNE